MSKAAIAIGYMIIISLQPNPSKPDLSPPKGHSSRKIVATAKCPVDLTQMFMQQLV